MEVRPVHQLARRVPDVRTRLPNVNFTSELADCFGPIQKSTTKYDVVLYARYVASIRYVYSFHSSESYQTHTRMSFSAGSEGASQTELIESCSDQRLGSRTGQRSLWRGIREQRQSAAYRLYKT